MSAESGFLGRGWAFPPAFGAGGSSVDTVSGLADIEQSLRIILGTTPGERVMQDRFGCDLPAFLFEEVDKRLLNKIQRQIGDAILEFEPRIKLDRVEVTEEDPAEGRLSIRVTYTVRGTNSRFNMVFPYYVMEATQAGP